MTDTHRQLKANRGAIGAVGIDLLIMNLYMEKGELIRDLCSVEFRTKSKTRRLIDEYEKTIIKNCIFWVKDWWAEDMPYGIKGLIKRLNKLYEKVPKVQK